MYIQPPGGIKFGKTYKVMGAPSQQESSAFAQRWIRQQQEASPIFQALCEDRLEHLYDEPTITTEADFRFQEEVLGKVTTFDDLFGSTLAELPTTYIYTNEPDRLTEDPDDIDDSAHALFQRMQGRPASFYSQSLEEVQTWATAYTGLMGPDEIKLWELKEEAEGIPYTPETE
jgi:hypothetical protein